MVQMNYSALPPINSSRSFAVANLKPLENQRPHYLITGISHSLPQKKYTMEKKAINARKMTEISNRSKPQTYFMDASGFRNAADVDLLSCCAGTTENRFSRTPGKGRKRPRLSGFDMSVLCCNLLVGSISYFNYIFKSSCVSHV